MLKKATSLFLTLFLLLSLTACALLAEPRQAESSDPAGGELIIVPGESPKPAAPETTSPNAGPTASPAPETQAAPPETEAEELSLDENGWYNTKEEVALYVHLYGHLPGNYITKKQAEALGWEGGSLEPYAPGKSIGGSHFGNYEGLLPDAKGRSWTECDIDTAGRNSRGAKRIVFSNDGLIYYTGDHYETFELLYGGD